MMENIFVSIAALSLSATWFALATVLIRFSFRKAPKWIFCVLWGIVALRLMIPVTFESRIGVSPDNEKITERIIYGETEEKKTAEAPVPYTPAIVPGEERGENVPSVTPQYPAHDSRETDAVNLPPSVVESPEVSAATEDLPEETGNKTASVLSLIWISGAGAMLIYAFVSYALLRKKVSTSVRLEKNVRQSENVKSPFILGAIRPKIYLPYSIKEEDLKYVISHEKAHIKRKDHLWKPLGFLLLSVFWFNPVLWLSYILFCRDVESACDEKVIKELSEDERRGYSSALLNCSAKRMTVSACPVAFGETGVKTRIKRVMNYKKPAFWIVIAVVVLSIAALTLFFTSKRAEESKNNEETEESEEQTGEENAEVKAFLLETTDSAFSYVTVYESKEKKVGRYPIHARDPEVKLVDGGFVSVSDSSGEGTNISTFFIDRETGKRSDTFKNVIKAENGYIVYAHNPDSWDDGCYVVIRRIFSIPVIESDETKIKGFSYKDALFTKAEVSEDRSTVDIYQIIDSHNTELRSRYDISGEKPSKVYTETVGERFTQVIYPDPDKGDVITVYNKDGVIMQKIQDYSGITVTVMDGGVIEERVGAGTGVWMCTYLDTESNIISRQIESPIAYKNGLAAVIETSDGVHTLVIKSVFDDSYRCVIHDDFPSWATFGTAVTVSLEKEIGRISYSFPDKNNETKTTVRTVDLPDESGEVYVAQGLKDEWQVDVLLTSYIENFDWSKANEKADLAKLTFTLPGSWRKQEENYENNRVFIKRIGNYSIEVPVMEVGAVFKVDKNYTLDKSIYYKTWSKVSSDLPDLEYGSLDSYMSLGTTSNGYDFVLYKENVEVTNNGKTWVEYSLTLFLRVSDELIVSIGLRDDSPDCEDAVRVIDSITAEISFGHETEDRQNEQQNEQQKKRVIDDDSYYSKFMSSAKHRSTVILVMDPETFSEEKIWTVEDFPELKDYPIDQIIRFIDLYPQNEYTKNYISIVLQYDKDRIAYSSPDDALKYIQELRKRDIEVRKLLAERDDVIELQGTVDLT